MDENLLKNYNSENGAVNYKNEYTEKIQRKVSDRLERRLFQRLFRRLGPVETLVDIPCGAGRLYSLFRAQADQIIEADWSFHMLRHSRQDTSGDALGHVRCNGLQLPFPDRAADLLVSIRLNHHFPEKEERLAHVGELLRVANRAVIVTWFSHHAPRAWMRRVRARWGGRKRAKFTLRTSEVRALGKQHGFRLVAAPSLVPLCLGSGHVFGLLIRD